MANVYFLLVIFSIFINCVLTTIQSDTFSRVESKSGTFPVTLPKYNARSRLECAAICQRSRLCAHSKFDAQKNGENCQLLASDKTATSGLELFRKKGFGPVGNYWRIKQCHCVGSYTMTYKTITECLQTCDANVNCVSIIYYNSDRRCYLKGIANFCAYPGYDGLPEVTDFYIKGV